MKINQKNKNTALLLSERFCCVSRNTELAKVFYYFDGNGTKQGSYNGEQLNALAENGHITPVWISVIWIICIVFNVMSLLASLRWIGMMANVVPGGVFGKADNTHIDGVLFLNLGLHASILLHLLLLLFGRIVLEAVCGRNQSMHELRMSCGRI